MHFRSFTSFVALLCTCSSTSMPLRNLKAKRDMNVSLLWPWIKIQEVPPQLEKELLCIEGDRAVEQTAQDEGVSLSEKSTWICSCVTYFRWICLGKGIGQDAALCETPSHLLSFTMTCCVYTCNLPRFKVCHQLRKLHPQHTFSNSLTDQTQHRRNKRLTNVLVHI